MSSNGITQVETFGFERTPDRSRHARPIDLFRLLFGGCNTFFHLRARQLSGAARSAGD